MKRFVMVILACLMLAALPVLAQPADDESIGYGDTVRGVISDDTPSLYYSFSGTAGDVVTITMIADDMDELDTYLYLYDAGGENELARNDDAVDRSLGRLNSQIVDFVLPETGEYVIEASRWRGAGAFTLLLESSENVGQPVVSDPGSDLSYGDTVRGAISDETPSVYYSFSGTAGDVVTITMIADDENELDTYLYLYDAGGENELARNDDAVDRSLGRWNSQIVDFVLPETGEYIIEASRWSGAGEFTLTLETDDMREGAADISTEATLVYGDTVRGVLDADTSIVYYAFSGTVGDVVTITMIADDMDELDTYLYLYDATGTNELARNDDAADSSIGRLNSQIVDFVLPQTGEYIIGASRWRGAGDFSLTLEGDESSVSLAASSVLVYGDAVRGVISDEVSSVYYSFNGIVGDVVTITMIADDMDDLDTYLYLYDATGTNELARNDDAVDSSIGRLNSQIVDFVLPETGEYVIEASSWRGAGDFTLRLESDDVSAAPVDLEDDGEASVQGLAVTVPEGWLIEADFDSLYLATDQAALDILKGGEADTPASGSVAIGLLPIFGEEIEMFGLTATTVEGLLQEFQVEANFGGEVETYEGVDFPAAIIFIEADDITPENAVLISTVFSEGFLLWAVQYGEGDNFEDYEDVVVEVISSLTYEGEPVYADDVADEPTIEEPIVEEPALAVGEMNLTVPAGWVTERDFEVIYLASDADALTVIRDSGISGVVADGQIGLSVIDFDDSPLASLIDISDDPAASLQSFFDLLEEPASVESYDTGDIESAIAVTSEGINAPTDAVVIFSIIEGRLVGFAVQFGAGDSYEDYEDIVLQVINSVTFE